MFFNLSSKYFNINFFFKCIYLFIWSCIWVFALYFTDLLGFEDTVAIFPYYGIDLPTMVFILQFGSVPVHSYSYEHTSYPTFDSTYSEIKEELTPWQYMKDFPHKEIPQERYSFFYIFRGDFELSSLFFLRIVPLFVSYSFFFDPSSEIIIEEFLVICFFFFFANMVFKDKALLYDESSLDLEDFSKPVSQLGIHKNLLSSKSFVIRRKK